MFGICSVRKARSGQMTFDHFLQKCGSYESKYLRVVYHMMKVESMAIWDFLDLCMEIGLHSWQVHNLFSHAAVKMDGQNVVSCIAEP